MRKKRGEGTGGKEEERERRSKGNSDMLRLSVQS